MEPRDKQVVWHTIDTMLTYELDEVIHRDVFEMAWQVPELRCGGGPSHIHLGIADTGSIRTCCCLLLRWLARRRRSKRVRHGQRARNCPKLQGGLGGNLAVCGHLRVPRTHSVLRSEGRWGAVKGKVGPKPEVGFRSLELTTHTFD